MGQAFYTSGDYAQVPGPKDGCSRARHFVGDFFRELQEEDAASR
jgi:hypothetical protein